MTAQVREKLFCNWGIQSISTEPLAPYLEHRKDMKFISGSTACWRGYQGKWEIKDNKLYLIEFNGSTLELGGINLNDLFPNQKEVLAYWFNGEIVIPQGYLLEYIHAGYDSLYESDLILVFENGILVKQYEVDNRKEYENSQKQKEQEIRERPAKEAKKKRKEKNVRMLDLYTVCMMVLVIVSSGIGLFYLFKLGTLLGYVLFAIFGIGITSLYLIVIIRLVIDLKKNP